MEIKRDFGLIGYPLGHSFSQKYFTKKFEKLNLKNFAYQTIPLSDITKLRNLVNAQKTLIGLNVTTPYKELVIPYLQDLDPLVIRVGTVNTICIYREENDRFRMKGFNTDVLGLQKLIHPLVAGKDISALILGSGGSAKTTAFVLKELCIPYKFVSRNKQTRDLLNYDNLNSRIISDNKLIINATPVGMYPYVQDYPKIPYEGIGENHICIDLVYNPAHTSFMDRCSDFGALVKNGEEMLYEQADKAWEIWQQECF
ncbi:MAG: shikimate dehydrogenase [Bacteroidales bacterium]|nr:shikimate dehydrogenase [Bacteroidales bacterium]